VEIEEQVRKSLSEAGVPLLGCQTASGPTLRAVLEEAASGPADTILIAGGDGSVATAATVLAGSRKVLGILPMGTFNLAARDLGVPLDVGRAIEALREAPAIEMDVLSVDGGLYLCVVVLGFYPSLIFGRPQYHGSWVMRAFRIAMRIVQEVALFPPLELVLRQDGKELQYRTRLAIVTNNEYEEVFGLLPKRRSLNGGYLTVYVSRHRTRRGMLKSLVKWLFGRWKADREITVIRASSVDILVRRHQRIPVMLDGELRRMRLPFKVDLQPGAVRVLAPRGADPTRPE
jgi:diacylglycerol kinase family enzyme